VLEFNLALAVGGKEREGGKKSGKNVRKFCCRLFIFTLSGFLRARSSDETKEERARARRLSPSFFLFYFCLFHFVSHWGRINNFYVFFF